MDEPRPHVSEARLLAHLDRELGAAEHRDVDRHLAECGACRRRLAGLREASDLVRRSLEEIDVPVPEREPGDVRSAADASRRQGVAGAAGPADAGWRRILRRGALLKAALVVLGVATAAAAVLPGSPLRDWVADAVRPLVTGPRSGPDVPAPSRSRPPLESVSIPVEDRAVVQIRDAARELAVRVRMSDRTRLTVTARGARFETGEGSVEVAGPVGPEVIVELPRPVASARISADGRVLLERERGRLWVHATADTTPEGFLLRPDGELSPGVGGEGVLD